MNERKTLSCLVVLCVLLFLIFFVILIAVGITKINASGWSVILGALIGGSITILSVILNYVFQILRKREENRETLRRDAQSAAVELVKKMELSGDKTVEQLCSRFATIFNSVFKSFEEKSKQKNGGLPSNEENQPMTNTNQ